MVVAELQTQTSESYHCQTAFEHFVGGKKTKQNIFDKQQTALTGTVTEQTNLPRFLSGPEWLSFYYLDVRCSSLYAAGAFSFNQTSCA